MGIATRTLEKPITFGSLLTDPNTYGIIAAGALALLALATALQRGGVTQATAAMVVAETVIPSAIGLAFLGDEIRPGFQVVAGIGLLVAIGGSVALARLGEIPEDDATATANTDADADADQGEREHHLSGVNAFTLCDFLDSLAGAGAGLR